MPFAVRYVVVAVLGFACLMFACPEARSQNYAFTPADPVRAQLLNLGKAGQTIEIAREKVLEILKEPNGCSDWFEAANPDAAGVFATLRYFLDENDPGFITALRSDSGGLLFKHPYAGSTTQNAGLHAVITLNAHGAFFANSARLMRQEIIGSAPHRAGWHSLEISSYPGNTLSAQITTLLHELGHVIGRIPDDSDEFSGQSTRNTREVVRHCRGAIKASLRHARTSSKAAANGTN